MWTRKVTNWGRQRVLTLPKDLLDRLGWKTGDDLLITALGADQLTISRVENESVPDRVMEAMKPLPTIRHD